MQHAIIAIEDARFYEHGAIDVQGTLRALFINSAERRRRPGWLVDHPAAGQADPHARTPPRDAAAQGRVGRRTFARKFDELRYAVWVEDHLTKDQILEHYLNIAYFGDGAYGIEAAAHHYFSTTAAELTLTAGRAARRHRQEPVRLRPDHRPAADAQGPPRHRHRPDARAAHHHAPGARKARRSKAKLGLHLHAASRTAASTRKAPWFCDYLLRATCSHDPDLGKTAEERKHADLRRRPDDQDAPSTCATSGRPTTPSRTTSIRHDQAIGGLAMVEPGTGYVRALAQSRPMGTNKKKGQTYLNYTVPDAVRRLQRLPGRLDVQAVRARSGDQARASRSTRRSTRRRVPTRHTSATTRPATAATTRRRETYTFHNSTESGNKDLYTGTRESVNTFYRPARADDRPVRAVEAGQARWASSSTRRAASPTSTGCRPSPSASPTSARSRWPRPTRRSPTAACTATRRRSSRSATATARSSRTTGPQCNRVMKPAEADAVNDILKGVIDRRLRPGPVALDQPRPARPEPSTTRSPSGSSATRRTWPPPRWSPAPTRRAPDQPRRPRRSRGNIRRRRVRLRAPPRRCGARRCAPSSAVAARRELPRRRTRASIAGPDGRRSRRSTARAPRRPLSILTQLGFNPQIVSTQRELDRARRARSPTRQPVVARASSGQTVIIYLSNGVRSAATANRRQWRRQWRRRQRRRQRRRRQRPGNGPGGNGPAATGPGSCNGGDVGPEPVDRASAELACVPRLTRRHRRRGP